MPFGKFFFLKIVLFKIAHETWSMRILRGKLNQNVFFLVQILFQNLRFKISFFFKIVLLKNKFFLKICRIVKLLIQNLTRSFFFSTISDALKNSEIKIWRVVKILFQNLMRQIFLIQTPTSFETFSPKSDFYLIFEVLTEWWYLLLTLIPKLFQRGELKDNACYSLSRQMYNWNLPHVNSLRNVWGIAIWQDTFFTLVTDRSLWSIKCSRSAAFFKIRFCENKRKHSLVRILSVVSYVFVWATRRRTMERSWHLQSIYPILAAERYLPQSWHLSKLTRFIENLIWRHVCI